MKHELKTMRVYDLTNDTEGSRILVDRVWPRGIRKEILEPFSWAKEIAPSNELRTWFHHEPSRFAEFRERYRAELQGNPYAEQVKNQITKTLIEQDVVLLYSARDTERNQAVILKEWLEEIHE